MVYLARNPCEWVAGVRGWAHGGGVRRQLVVAGADAEQLDVLTSFLRNDLLQFDVWDVTISGR